MATKNTEVKPAIYLLVRGGVVVDAKQTLKAAKAVQNVGVLAILHPSVIDLPAVGDRVELDGGYAFTP